MQVPTYVTYDPYATHLAVRCLTEGRYVEQSANPQGRFFIPELGLWLGLWQGTRLEQTMTWLRWWDEAGALLLWSAEQADQERQRAEEEHQRAEALAAKLRELGVDRDQLTPKN